jgi:hypothetical protein
MKRIVVLFVLSLVLLTGSFSLFSYDNSANVWKVLPECIWASATGGGNWVTEVQITSRGTTAATVNAYFYYGGGSFRGPFVLTTDLAQYHTVKFSNILSTLDGLDAGVFTYYGRVGAVWFYTSSTDAAIHVTAKTVNGNYGKTFPGLNMVAANTAAQGRQMYIPLLNNTATYRTFTGFFNTSSTATYTVTFYVTGPAYTYVGTAFTKTFAPYEYLTFNPFVEAGVGAGSYDNYFLLINPTAGGSDVRGIMCFGAIANNTTNDPAALIAYPWDVSAFPALEMMNQLSTDPQK